MKNFTPAFDNALLGKHKKPVWLLKLDLVSSTGSTTLYLADQAITLWGQEWAPMVVRWDVLDRFFDPAESEVKVSDTQVILDNRPGALGPGANNLSYYFREYDLPNSKATIYLWLADAGLTEPSGANQNDLYEALVGIPEISGNITPALCPLDIVSREGEWDDAKCPWGDLLQGQFTRNQWPALPDKTIGDWKPMVFGQGGLYDGIRLSGAAHIGTVEGPTNLFDPTAGALTMEIKFPDSGKFNAQNPVPAPCDIYVGDWRFPITSAPRSLGGGKWEYRLTNSGQGNVYKLYIPTPLKGTTPVFVPSPSANWPTSSETDYGRFASAEPARGAPYHFFHGGSDSGNSKDGYHPGRSGPMIRKVYIGGTEVTGAQAHIDQSYGIVWLRSDFAGVEGRVGNPEKLRIKWTDLDGSFNSGNTWLKAEQLTAQYPHGYNAQANPCILGDFYIPASGGGAPVSSRLGLKNNLRYPNLGARMASARFVLRYTGVEAKDATFHISVMGQDYSFAATELNDGSGIKGAGWDVTLSQRGGDNEIWENNLGFPDTAISPVPRKWDIYELSRDITPEARSHLDMYHGYAGEMRASFSGTIWPFPNSIIALAAEIEILFEPVESAISGPRVTALVDGLGDRAGEILSEVIPAADIGAGFDDATLPSLNIRVDRQMSVCKFARKVLAESNMELKKNFLTGKWDLLKKSDNRDNVNPPPPAGGIGNIGQGELLADDDGLPMITRSRSAPESVVNEVTVDFLDESGRRQSVTVFDQGSIDSYGRKFYKVSLSSAMARPAAEDYALDILNAHSETSDYYMMTLPLGPALGLEPSDILQVTADMDGLFNTRMRVVSVEVDPGMLAEGRVSMVTVNAQRYSKARKGFGNIPFGTGPFGTGQVLKN